MSSWSAELLLFQYLHWFLNKHISWRKNTECDWCIDRKRGGRETVSLWNLTFLLSELYWGGIDKEHWQRQFRQYGALKCWSVSFESSKTRVWTDPLLMGTVGKLCVKLKTFTWEKLIKIKHFQTLPSVSNGLCELEKIHKAHRESGHLIESSSTTVINYCPTLLALHMIFVSIICKWSMT